MMLTCLDNGVFSSFGPFANFMIRNEHVCANMWRAVTGSVSFEILMSHNVNRLLHPSSK